jgi:hypothetical protein
MPTTPSDPLKTAAGVVWRLTAMESAVGTPIHLEGENGELGMLYIEKHDVTDVGEALGHLRSIRSRRRFRAFTTLFSAVLLLADDDLNNDIQLVGTLFRRVADHHDIVDVNDRKRVLKAIVKHVRRFRKATHYQTSNAYGATTWRTRFPLLSGATTEAFTASDRRRLEAAFLWRIPTPGMAYTVSTIVLDLLERHHGLDDNVNMRRAIECADEILGSAMRIEPRTNQRRTQAV